MAVGEDAPGDAQQPGPRLGGHVCDPPPRDDEHVGDDIVGLVTADPAPRVGAHRTGVLSVQ
jgi:hypothetical protein